MTVPASPSGRREGPDPLELPSGTTVRFVLLITAVAAVTAILVNGVSTMVFTSVNPLEAGEYYECMARATADAARRRAADPTVGIPPSFAADCRDPRAGTGWVIPSVASACLLAVVACVYAWLPAWRTRRRGYREPAGMPQLSACLEGLLDESGVRTKVTFLVEPLNPKVAALAFGRVRQRRVVLSGGLLTLFARDRGAFRTVVLHELAHIRNRDLDIAFLTMIVWRTSGPPLLVASAVAAPAGLLLLPVRPALTTAVLAFCVGTVVLAVLVTLLKNAVLRSRELYADARVKQWEGSAEPLHRLFACYGLGSAPHTAAGGRPAVLRVHPPLALRVRALGDDRLLSGTGFWDMCAVGAAVAFLYDVVRLGPIGGGSLASPVTETVAAVLGTALLVGAAGTVLWRASAQPFGGPSPAQVRQAGVGLGLGLCAVRLLSPTGASSAVMLGGRGLTLVFPYAALMCLCGWALARWLTLAARTWTPVVARNRHPRPVLCAVLGASAAGLVPAFDFLMTLPSMTLYAASFIAPSFPGALVFVAGTAYLAVNRAGSLLTPLVLTAAAVPLVGQRVAWRRGMERTFTGFGPLRPAAGRVVRLGLPAGLAVALVCVPALLAVPSWGAAVLICTGQVIAALWAGRGYAPLSLARGVLAAYGAGVTAGLVMFTVAQALTSCLVGTGPCRVHPSGSQALWAFTVPSAGAAVAWAFHAAFRSLGRRGGGGGEPPHRGPGPSSTRPVVRP
ncbi:M48 family metalloprotease [Streptomyces sp. HB2AG]|uniref:M48 family metalloprotease n=1 Tax=Streptomyces sp. HB2AG TaxID=2983400 RepID=UPI0022AB456B|nr:M48 family metalloprotease [Streptomyces sp. HB2AG]MCZ2525873.1 M48 family metalloprotease [Streptomyces sp. HB2AG]